MGLSTLLLKDSLFHTAIAGTILCIVPHGGGDVNTRTVASKDTRTSTTPAVANKDAGDTGTTTLANKTTGTTAVAGQSIDIIDLDIQHVFSTSPPISNSSC